MPDPNPTVGELFRAKAVTAEQVSAAVDAYLTEPYRTGYAIAEGYRVNLLDAVSCHHFASRLMAEPGVSLALRRDAVRTAILLARAQKA